MDKHISRRVRQIAAALSATGGHAMQPMYEPECMYHGTPAATAPERTLGITTCERG